jgi:hypothetical protein
MKRRKRSEFETHRKSSSDSMQSVRRKLHGEFPINNIEVIHSIQLVSGCAALRLFLNC